MPASALLLAGTFYLYSVSTILFLGGIVPGFFGIYFDRRYRSVPDEILRRPPLKCSVIF